MKVKEGVFVDRFDDMNIFLKTIKSRPFNTVFKDYPDGRGSENDDYSFSKTKSYKESEDIMKIGYKEGLADLKKAEKSIPVCSKGSKAVPTASVIGYTPHVPNAIAGIPCSMISHKQVVMKSKMISMAYDMTASWEVNADDFVKAFESVDILVSPTCPTTAFDLNSKANNPLEMYLTDIATISSNLVGAPALSMPCGFDKGGMPIGIQIIAKNLDEMTLLQSAYALEQELSVYNQRPNI